MSTQHNASKPEVQPHPPLLATAFGEPTTYVTLATAIFIFLYLFVCVCSKWLLVFLSETCTLIATEQERSAEPAARNRSTQAAQATNNRQASGDSLRPLTISMAVCTKAAAVKTTSSCQQQ